MLMPARVTEPTLPARSLAWRGTDWFAPSPESVTGALRVPGSTPDKASVARERDNHRAVVPAARIRVRRLTRGHDRRRLVDVPRDARFRRIAGGRRSGDDLICA